MNHFYYYYFKYMYNNTFDKCQLSHVDNHAASQQAVMEYIV